jgi:hypothetical protein
MQNSIRTPRRLARVWHLAYALAASWLLALPLGAALSIPVDGSDGELHIATNTTIDLSQAVTGSWDANNSANAGKGIYDASKWAIVFKYTQVTIDAAATVTFINHPSRAPVVWLVSGNATIAGTLSLKGANAVSPPGLAEPGPGGFRGGMSYFTPGVSSSAGFGPGGGGTAYIGSGGGYSGAGAGPALGSLYGNPSLIPLIGGSGGGGDTEDSGKSGAGGGGAILLACAGTLTVSGTITANGGNSPATGYNAAGGSGSGGGIRLVAATLTGNGVIQAIGGSTTSAGGLGRIRIERVVNEGNPQVTPDPSVVALADASTPVIWPPANAPTVRVLSIGGEAVPDDPRANFGTAGADTTIAQASTTNVVVETTNVEEAAQVFVRVTPRSNANFTRTQASTHDVVSTDPLVIRWTASVPVQPGYSAVQVQVVRP